MRKIDSIGKHFVYLFFCMVVFQGCSSPEDNAYKPSPQKESSGSVPQTETDLKLEKAGPRSFNVVIQQMKFTPAEIAVNEGDTVIWINRDIVDHNVTEEKNKEWSSSTLAPGKSWNLVVKKDADYLCTIHPVMKGKLTVK